MLGMFYVPMPQNFQYYNFETDFLKNENFF